MRVAINCLIFHTKECRVHSEGNRGKMKDFKRKSHSDSGLSKATLMTLGWVDHLAPLLQCKITVHLSRLQKTEDLHFQDAGWNSIWISLYFPYVTLSPKGWHKAKCEPAHMPPEMGPGSNSSLLLLTKPFWSAACVSQQNSMHWIVQVSENKWKSQQECPSWFKWLENLEWMKTDLRVPKSMLGSPCACS